MTIIKNKSLDKDFYRKHWYADIYEKQENQIDDVEYILSTIGNSPKRILEVACGGGRILEPLAKAGHSVTGFDMDEYMLEKCRARIKGMRNANCYMADAIKQDWGTGYEVVVMGGNFLLNIISNMDYEKAQQLFIKKAASSLMPNGRLFLACMCEANFPSSQDPNEYTIFKGKDDLDTVGEFIMFDQHNDGKTRMHRSKRRIKIVTKEGKEKIIEWDVIKHFPSLVQINDWLKESGFIIENEAGDFIGSCITDETKCAIIWAKKIL